jgi:glycosyltransferase involved in cell wall biosynthesis
VKVCYFGTYRAEYARNQIMIEGLRRAGVELIECQQPLWRGIDDRVQAASGGWFKPRFIARVCRTYFNLLKGYRAVGAYDVLIVGYPGQFDVYLAWLLSRVRRKPLVWDIFMSIYLIALERELDRRSRFTVQVIRWIERMACRLPDRLILDTAEYVAWFHRTHHVNPDRFRLVPTGADDRVYCVVETPPANTIFTVIYYGTFIRNHGVPTIVEAAHLLAEDAALQFILIGDGPEKAAARALAEKYQLKNITFVDWVQRGELPQRVAQADVCLGVFGTTPQSMMTVQNKIYEALAMRKPLITGDAPTVRAALQHGAQVYLCERANPQALAEAILTLKNNPVLREKLAAQGQQLYFEQFDLAHNGQRFAAALQEVAQNRSV